MSGTTTLSVTLWEQVISHLEGEHLGNVRCVCQTARQAVENYVQQVIITKSSIDAAPDLSRWPNLQNIVITDDMRAPYPELLSLGAKVCPLHPLYVIYPTFLPAVACASCSTTD